MKELLLAKSNLRKGKGLAIGLVILILLAACFLNIVLVIFRDIQNDPYKKAEELNTEKALIILTGENKEKIDEKYIYDNFGKDSINDIEIEDSIAQLVDFKYASGTVNTTAFITTYDKAINCRIGKTEIVEEDNSITDNYIYIPYQFHTGGQINIGELYDIKLKDKTYTYKVKGFINNVTSGCFNAGSVKLIIDDKSYDGFIEDNGEKALGKIIKLDLNDNEDQSKVLNKICSKIVKDYPTIETDSVTLETAIFARTFVGVIIGVSFLVVSFIILIIVLLMLSNSISNYIRENIKILGAIKAVGYTSREIKFSFIVQFVLIALLGLVLGISASYGLLPTICSILTSQSGMNTIISFSLSNALTTAIVLITIIVFTVLFFIRKIKKIEPITALRNGMNTHNFKKNRIHLEKTFLPLNVALAVKTMFNNKKQNIATFIITFFLIFSAVVALAMYQNFSADPDISILTFELLNGGVIADNDKDGDIREYIESLDGTKNVRIVTNMALSCDDARIMTYIVDDADKLNNKNVCYEGRFPKYDNEICLSGKFAKVYNYKIGDEVEMYLGDNKAKYILTGLIQTTNNMGQEAVMTLKGSEKIIDKESIAKTYYFDVDEGVDVQPFLDKIKDKFGDRIQTCINFDETIKGSMGVFITVSNAMVVVIMSINVVVILLVLYLLMKTLISNKKKEYGVLKAVGYTSKNIVFQNALSYMPSIIVATIVSSITSVILVNPYLSMIMGLFGIMRLSLTIPINLVIYSGIGFVIISFIFAIVLSLKVRKIEAYKLLTDE